MGLILITHDLRVAFSVCSRVYVLYAGTIVETAPAAELERSPRHPYSLGLLTSDPPVDRTLAQLPVIRGPGARARRCRRHVRLRAALPVGDRSLPRRRATARAAWGHGVCRHARALPEIGDQIVTALDALLAERGPTAEVEERERPLVAIDGLTKVFAGGRSSHQVHALRGVSLRIGRGESVGLVGESGLREDDARPLPRRPRAPDGGLNPRRWGRRTSTRRQAFRGVVELRKNVQMVFQDPYSSLDPKQAVGKALAEVLRANGHARRRDCHAGARPAQPGRPAGDVCAAPALDPLRRRAPASGDCQGARRRAAADHLRRARLCPGCFRAGAGAESAGGAPSSNSDSVISSSRTTSRSSGKSSTASTSVTAA